MKTKPVLTLYVTTDCAACRRTRSVLRDCGEINSLVEVEVVVLDEAGAVRHPKVIGVPTIVFQDTVVGLGTPDCCLLAEQLRECFELSPDTVN